MKRLAALVALWVGVTVLPGCGAGSPTGPAAPPPASGDVKQGALPGPPPVEKKPK